VRPNRLAIFLLVLATSSALAQLNPSRPIEVVVPQPPGGSTDILGRLVAAKLGAYLSQPVVVQNKSGAGGNIGAEYVAKSRPDGYTLLVGGAQNTINANYYRHLPFDLLRDLVPVAMLGTSPNVMVVSATLPIHTPAEFVSYARQHEGHVSYASSGNGSSTQMVAELFKAATGIQLTHIPYRGSSPALTDLLGGQTQVMFDNISSSLPLIRAGQLRALALTGGGHIAALPQLRTFKEQGIDIDAGTWFCIFAPAATPRATIDLLNQAIRHVVAEPELQARLTEFGTTSRDWPPDVILAFTRDEIKKWRPAALAASAKAN
jgi:tripartite-type tricarboxylate transporter receptor subunit TctC